MKSTRVFPTIALTAAAVFAATLTGCGSHSEASPTSTSSVADLMLPRHPAAPAGASSCPSTQPRDAVAPEWTLSGATGNVAVTGSTDTAAPVVKVGKPFTVNQTQVHTLHPGDGTVVANNATVSVCYMGVNGRDGSVFDSSYERGEPVDFPLNRVVPGFQKAIAGQKVGSTVAVAMTSADGYPDGQPAAGIKPGDTLVFAIKILSASQ